MGVVETALFRTAGSVVAKAGTVWLGRRKEQRERDTDLVELIGAGVADDLGLRRATRGYAEIVDTVYERLQPQVRRGLDDNETAAVLDAVADTLHEADLSDTALFADDLDPALVAGRLRRLLPGIPGRAGLGEQAQRLYDRLLDDCCVCLTQLVVHLGPFQARAAVRMLDRLTTVADGLAQVLARIPVTSFDAPEGDQHDVAFRGRYLHHVLDKLDVLELFGVNVHRYRLRTPLSIAYISLAVTGSGVRGGRRGPRWDPGRFRQDGPAGSASSVRAEQALGNAERILLRGDAGSGKTTLQQWIAVTAARHGFTGDLEGWNGRTPFLIRLRDYAKQALPPPENFLDRIAPAVAGRTPPLWVHRQLAGGAILLIDGVDEISENQRAQVREWLRDILREYPDLRVVVTSRPAAASARWLSAEGFTSVFLERMGPADIKALIRHWHDAVAKAGDLPCEPHRLPAYEQRLLAQLDGSAHLQNLAGSPLLCAMLCALNLDRDSNLPRNRMDLYQAAVDMLLHKRDDKRGVHNPRPELTSGDQAHLLQEVAWWLTENGRTELSRDEAAARLERRLAGIRQETAPAPAVLDHLIQRSGIIREPVPDRIDFVHRTFQEYLAAREAADQGRAGALLQHAQHDTWRETIILAAGHANTPVRRELLSGLLTLADEQPQHARKLRLLAGACLETSPAVAADLLARIRGHLRGLKPRSLSEARSLAAVGEPLLAELPAELSGLTEAQAAAVVKTVALINGPAALATLGRYATDRRPKVQRELVDAWEYFDPTEYVDGVLTDAPLEDGSASVRSAALISSLPRLRHLTDTEVSLRQKIDLSSLADTPHLRWLSLYGGFTGLVDDIAEHRELVFVHLNLEGRRADLSPLSKLEKMQRLNLTGLAPDQDLEILRELTGLTGIYLYGRRVSPRDLARLARLTYLSAAFTDWDPRSLRHLPNLEYVCLDSSELPRGGLSRLVEQLSDLSKLTSVQTTDCDWLTDLSELGSLVNLTRLSIETTEESDLSPLAALVRLEYLSLGDIGTLAPLTPLPALRDLWIGASTPDLDLTPLRGKRVTLHLPKSARIAPVPIPAGVKIRRY